MNIKTKEVKIKEDISVSGQNPLLFIAGPCVIESEAHSILMADKLSRIAERYNLNYVFKASFDKANRSSINSFRGIGIEKGLKTLEKIRDSFSVPVTSDIHNTDQAKLAGDVLDIIQIPAFLCRQTDLLLSAAETGKPVNVKKGQFLAPHDVKNIIEKLESAGCSSFMITERGSSFGYNNLVVDFRSFPIIRKFGYPVIFDATHSVQLPGGGGHVSSGQREFVETLAFAAVAAGCDGIFLEVHDKPEEALSDGHNMLNIDEFEMLIPKLIKLRETVKTI
ncbi:3-deoxy-8-phosphooctulonate synthase [bacterium]|nr:3-deoxy-8-phosphooctulonate synthase [bacterium]